MVMNDKKKELLSKTQLTIKEVKELFETNLDKARKLVHEIRNKNNDFYNNPIYKQSCVSPLHLLNYLGITREEYFNYIIK